MTATFTATIHGGEADGVGGVDARDARSGPAEHPGARVRRPAAVVPPVPRLVDRRAVLPPAREGRARVQQHIRAAGGVLAVAKFVHEWKAARLDARVQLQDVVPRVRHRRVGQAGLGVGRAAAGVQAGGLSHRRHGQAVPSRSPEQQRCSHPDAAGGAHRGPPQHDRAGKRHPRKPRHAPVLTSAPREFRYVNPDAQIFQGEPHRQRQQSSAARAPRSRTTRAPTNGSPTPPSPPCAPSPARQSLFLRRRLPQAAPVPAAAAALPGCVCRPAAAARRSAHRAEGRAGRRLLPCDAINSRTDVGGPYWTMRAPTRLAAARAATSCRRTRCPTR